MSRQLSISYQPRRWQRECHLGRKRFSVYALHRRAGKTELAIMELIEAALACELDLGVFVYLAPLLKQAESVVWRRLLQKLQPLTNVPGTIHINNADLSVTFAHNGSMIRLFGANNPDAMRGMRLDGVVIDEVAQIEPMVWDEIVQPALSDRLGWAIFIGTPNGINLFSQLFFYAKRDPLWHAAVYTVYETDGAIDPVEIARLRRPDVMTETAFAREYLCDFNAAGDDQLISLADAENASHRDYTETDFADSPRIIGVDPARFGNDRSTIVRRQGLQMLPAIAMRGIDNMELATRTASLINDWHPDAVFIDAGAGSGVIDRLRQLGFNVFEVAFGGKSSEPTLYVNKRTEMWWLMREWLRAGGAIPNDIALKQELATPCYFFDAQNRRALESKDDIKKRLKDGASPDLADALALTFAAPVLRASKIARQMMQYQERFAKASSLSSYNRLRHNLRAP
jgi:hypothetical protein